MFRQKEIFVGGWEEKTLASMHRRRFENAVAQFPQLGAERLCALNTEAFRRKMERCWQDVPQKPMRAQQEALAWETVLRSIELQADCLSSDEHELIERALLLGGCVRLEDVRDLAAAQALSLRLMASVGLVSGKPYVELEQMVIQPLAKAMAREQHENVRRRFQALRSELDGLLYCSGVLDDRYPQKMIMDKVLADQQDEELCCQLARRYLWASYDCLDYSDGVMLMHPALAEPECLIRNRRGGSGEMLLRASTRACRTMEDILPEEIPLQKALEGAIVGATRSGVRAEEAATAIRYLCKQGAPLEALEDVLQSFLLVRVSPWMRRALVDVFVQLPKWTGQAGCQ